MKNYSNQLTLHTKSSIGIFKPIKYHVFPNENGLIKIP
jgi:hypothetical protein